MFDIPLFSITCVGPTPMINDLLQNGSDDDVAVSGPDRSALSYRDLRVQVTYTIESLNNFGIGRGDRVAIVLPNGPEMATAFVSIACCATTAPRSRTSSGAVVTSCGPQTNPCSCTLGCSSSSGTSGSGILSPAPCSAGGPAHRWSMRRSAWPETRCIWPG